MSSGVWKVVAPCVWKHNFSTLFIWKLNMVIRGVNGCQVEKGWTAGGYTVSIWLSWERQCFPIRFQLKADQTGIAYGLAGRSTAAATIL